MKRVITGELLDTDSGTPAEIAASLGDLQRINRWLGGIATSASLIRSVARQIDVSSLSLIEVAAGSGYVPQVACERLQKHGLHVRVTLLDRSASHLRGGMRAVAGDALALPFRNASFDLVSCNLFAHHLNPGEFVRFVDEALRVCRVALLINDLVRHPSHLTLVYAGLPFYRSRLTRHDAPASVRQAYTPEEMRSMLGRSRASRAEVHRHYLFRMGWIVWKSNAEILRDRKANQAAEALVM
jgi:ubiquinone/menaquinone biosynthesis C-methylase UbiE